MLFRQASGEFEEQQKHYEREQEELQRRQQEIIDQVLKVDQSRPASGLYMSDRGDSVLGQPIFNLTQNASSTHISNNFNNNNNNDETIITSTSEKHGYLKKLNTIISILE